MFRNEFDVLEIRLHELDKMVDFFVLVEGNFTFQGGEKPLHFGLALETHSLPPGIEKFRQRIHYVPLTESPDTEDPWTRESFQRNAILLGLEDATPGDGVMIGDVDEIPRAKALPKAFERLAHCDQVSLEQSLSFYHVNALANIPWYGTQCLSVQRIREKSPQAARTDRANNEIEPNGGAHWCNLGDAAWLIEKIESFSHMEVNLPRYKDPKLLAACIDSHKEMTDRDDLKFEVKALEDIWLPRYLLDNQERFAHLLAEPSERLAETAVRDG